jgi:hypothetical protein
MVWTQSNLVEVVIYKLGDNLEKFSRMLLGLLGNGMRWLRGEEA